MVLKISLCDDDTAFLTFIEEQIQAAIGADNDITVTPFHDSSILFAAIEKLGCEHDVYILDIEMPLISGMDIAQAIRARSDTPIIIFLSAYNSYVFQSFAVNPFRFIRKSRLETELPQALSDLVTKKISCHRTYYLVKVHNGELQIARDAIAYIQKEGRKIVLHKKDGESIDVFGTVTSHAIALCDGSFSRVNSGLLVNVSYIKAISGSDLILENEIKMPISRANKKHIISDINCYWRGML